jgi:hypothetical protein
VDAALVEAARSMSWPLPSLVNRDLAGKLERLLA